MGLFPPFFLLLKKKKNPNEINNQQQKTQSPCQYSIIQTYNSAGRKKKQDIERIAIKCIPVLLSVQEGVCLLCPLAMQTLSTG